MTPEVSDVEETDKMPIAGEDFLQEQGGNPFSKQAAKTAEQSRSQYDRDRYGIVVRKSALDGMLQCVVSKRWRARVLHLAHHPRVSGSPGGWRM